MSVDLWIIGKSVKAAADIESPVDLMVLRDLRSERSAAEVRGREFSGLSVRERETPSRCGARQGGEGSGLGGGRSTSVGSSSRVEVEEGMGGGRVER